MIFRKEKCSLAHCLTFRGYPFQLLRVEYFMLGRIFMVNGTKNSLNLNNSKKKSKNLGKIHQQAENSNHKMVNP